MIYWVDGEKWERLPSMSATGQEVDHISPLDEPSDCFLCKYALKDPKPATRFALVQTFKERLRGAEEAMFTITVCDHHRGQWKHTPNLVVMESQMRRTISQWN